MKIIKNWLDKKNVVKYPSNKQVSYDDKIDIYYTKYEIQKFSKNINKDSDYINEYYTDNLNKKIKIYIPEHTRRFESDNLFTRISSNICII